MAYFHFKTLNRYTSAILDLFNEIEVQSQLSNGKIYNRFVPIQYTNKEKSEVISQLSDSQIFEGNTQILPRMSLVFEGLQVAADRQTNKFLKINAEYNGKKYNFQFNSVPYNFNYTVVCQARGMNEASIIMEQILSYFNPTYTMRIKEIPMSNVEPTSIVLELTDTQIEQQMMDDYSTNIVTIRFNLTLRGNIYPAIKDQGIIKEIQLFLYNEDLLNLDFEKTSVIVKNADSTTKYTNFDLKPLIKDVIFENSTLKCIFSDPDSHADKIKFKWIIANKESRKNTADIKISINVDEFPIKVYAIDEDGNVSDTFEKIIKKDIK